MSFAFYWICSLELELDYTIYLKHKGFFAKSLPKNWIALCLQNFLHVIFFGFHLIEASN